VDRAVSYLPVGDLLLPFGRYSDLADDTLEKKDEMADLSAAEKRALKAALEAELALRAARRRLRRK